eukprot:64470_1
MESEFAAINMMTSGFQDSVVPTLQELSTRLEELLVSQGHLLTAVQHEETKRVTDFRKALSPVFETMALVPEYRQRLANMPARMQRIRKRTARIKSRAIRLADTVRTDNERKLLETENNSAKPSPYAQQPKSAFDTKKLQSSVDSLFSSFKRLTSSDGMGKSAMRRRRPLVNNAYPAATVSTSSLTSENISRFSSISDSS